MSSLNEPTGPTGDSWTNAEIVRSLRRIENNVSALDGKIDTLDGKFIRVDFFESVLKSQQLVFENHERRITALEGWGVWASRLIIGALILGVLGLLIHQQGTF